MADEIELPETPETPESRKERAVGLIIAAIAVVLAIVTHIGNEIHQDEVLAHVDASDQFSYYQTKKTHIDQLGLNSDIIRLSQDRLSSAGEIQAMQLLAGYEAETKHLEQDGDKIKELADEHVLDATKLAARASVLDIGEIALQISVVLCSITILTEQRLFMRLGIAVALAGVTVAAWVLLIMH
jgi:hypothetical protein